MKFFKKRNSEPSYHNDNFDSEINSDNNYENYKSDNVMENNVSSLNLENYSVKILLATLLLLPILFIPSQTIPFQFTKTTLVFFGVLISLIVFLVARLKEGKITLPKSSLLYSLWLIPLAYLLSSVFSSNPQLSFVGYSFEIDTFSFMLLMSVFVSMLIFLMKKKEQILNSYLVLFISFIALWVFQGLRLMFGPDFLSFGNVLSLSTSNILGKWNDLSIFFGLATIMSLVTLATVELNKTYKKVLYVMLLISLFFLSVVNFTIVWVVVGMFAFGFLVQSVYSRMFTSVSEMPAKKSNTTMTIASITVLLIAAIFIFGGDVTRDKVSSFFNISQIEARPSWQSTVGVAKNVYEDNLLFGSGPNTFVKDWTLFRGTSINNTIFWNADFISGIGTIPTSFVTTGIVGGIAWIIFLITFLYSGIRNLILSRMSNSFSYFLTLSSFLAGLYLWIASIAYTPNVVLVTLAFFFTGTYIASLRYHDSNKLEEKEIVFAGNPKVGFIAVFLLTFILLVSVTGLYAEGKQYIASVKFQKGVVALNNAGDLDQAEKSVLSAIKYSSSDRYYRILSDINLGRISLLQNEKSLTQDELRLRFQQLLANAVSYAQRATEIDGTNYQNWVGLGGVYQSVVPLRIDGAYENAKSSYDTALKYNPDSPAIYLSMARLEIANNNNGLAREYITKALNKKNNYTEAIFLLSQLDINEGNLNKAIESVEAAAILDPNNPVVFFQLGLLRYNRGDDEIAKNAFLRAIGLNSNYANARYFLGLTYYRLGNNEDAIKQFEVVSQLNQDNKEVKSIISNLKDGKNPFDRGTKLPEDREVLPVDEN